MKKIDYFFDFLSPYSYLSWVWLRDHRPYFKEHCIDIGFFPVPLVKVIKRFPTLGPAEIPSKRNYLFKDCLRYSKLHGIEFQTPAVLPFNSSEALRLSVMEVSGARQFEVIDCLFRGGWEEGLNLQDEDILKACLDKAHLESDDLLEGAKSKAARKSLKENFKLAESLDLFGLPCFHARVNEESEIFWGNDSLSYLKLFMEGRDPLSKDKLDYFEKNYPITLEKK